MIYFDHAATTPLDPRVLNKMSPYLNESFFNPSLNYRKAVRTRSAISEVRAEIASIVGVKEKEIIFTSGGTEGDNIAIKGVALANKSRGKHIIVSKIEHAAVLNSARWLQKMGYEVSYLDVDENGLVNLDNLRKLIREDTILVSVMYANNETGTVQPIKEISEICHEKNIYFHTDGVQAFGHILLNLKEIDADIVTVSGHKIYGPKGSGFIYIKEGIKVDDIVSGGEQERGIRPGTENVAAIIGIGEAVRLLAAERVERVFTEQKVCDRLIEGITKIPGTYVNGDLEHKLPGVINFSFEGIEGEALMILLDKKGICVSTGSACEAGNDAPSHVLTSMGRTSLLAKGSLRISLGYENTIEEADYVTEAVKEAVSYLRSLRM